MKKIITAIVAIVMMLSSSVVLAQQVSAIAVNPVQNVIATQGIIEEVSKDQVRVSGEGTYNDIILHVQDGTYILNAQDGTPVLLKDLKQGDAITAYYGPAVTRSLPPQGNAIALIVGTPEKGNAGMYMKVGQIQENKDGSIRVLCTNAERLVTIKPDIFAQISNIKEGSELIVWYDIMTMSIPAQATATKVVLLPAKTNIQVNTAAGTIVVNGQKLALNNTIINGDNTVMLPLRAITESLGYRVTWHSENNTIELQNTAHTLNLTIGSKEYSGKNGVIQLDNVPELVNGTTFVPVEFFTNILEQKVEVR